MSKQDTNKSNRQTDRPGDRQTWARQISDAPSPETCATTDCWSLWQASQTYEHIHRIQHVCTIANPSAIVDPSHWPCSLLSFLLAPRNSSLPCCVVVQTVRGVGAVGKRRWPLATPGWELTFERVHDEGSGVLLSSAPVGRHGVVVVLDVAARELPVEEVDDGDGPEGISRTINLENAMKESTRGRHAASDRLTVSRS